MASKAGPATRRRSNGYPLHQSPFYKLESKERLAFLVGSSLEELQLLAASESNFRKFSLQGKPDITGRIPKTRFVQEPKPVLARIHKRIFRLLSRIEVPTYLHSAVTGRSYISNAAHHLGGSRGVKVDIRNFYPSTKRHQIRTFFHERMQCSADASTLLSRICTCDGVLPTGSALSCHLSFFTHQSLFDDLSKLARERGLEFTVYVDDLFFSGERATRSLLVDIEKIVHRHKLSLRMDKSAVFHANSPMAITGVIVEGTQLRVPHRRLLKIRLLESLLKRTSGIGAKLPILEQLVGILGEATQIESRFKEKVRRRSIELERARRSSRIKKAIALARMPRA